MMSLLSTLLIYIADNYEIYNCHYYTKLGIRFFCTPIFLNEVKNEKKICVRLPN